HRLAVEGAGGEPPGAAADDLVRAALQPLQADRTAVLLHAGPARLRADRVVGHAAVPVLPELGGLDDAGAAVPGADRDPRHPADQRLRVHRSALAARLGAPCRHAAAGYPGEAAVRVDPPGLLQRAAGDGDRHAGFAGRAGLPELR